MPEVSPRRGHRGRIFAFSVPGRRLRSVPLPSIHRCRQKFQLVTQPGGVRCLRSLLLSSRLVRRGK